MPEANPAPKRYIAREGFTLITPRRKTINQQSNPGRRLTNQKGVQGSQFTGQAFTGVLLNAGVAISMDGKGAWQANVFVERLWRSIKYEEIYLKAYDSVREARASIGRSLTLDNGRSPHWSLDRKTPDQAYSDRLPQIAAA